MPLSKAARRILGNLADHEDRTVADMVRERGGNASNVRQAGPWANRTLADTVKAAAQGDQTAAIAIKIVKQARRLGEEH